MEFQHKIIAFVRVKGQERHRQITDRRKLLKELNDHQVEADRLQRELKEYIDSLSQTSFTAEHAAKLSRMNKEFTDHIINDPIFKLRSM